MKKFGLLVGGFLALLAGMFGVNQLDKIGSVSQGSEYHSTTLIATTSAQNLFQDTHGTFGSIIISTLGTGNVMFYDATTTDVNLRGGIATSSLLVIATIGASQAAGTYVYDVAFFNGLLGVFNGSQGTSTITYRR